MHARAEYLGIYFETFICAVFSFSIRVIDNIIYFNTYDVNTFAGIFLFYFGTASSFRNNYNMYGRAVHKILFTNEKKIPNVKILFHCTTVVVRSNDLIIVETVINYYYTILNTV